MLASLYEFIFGFPASGTEDCFIMLMFFTLFIGFPAFFVIYLILNKKGIL